MQYRRGEFTIHDEVVHEFEPVPQLTCQCPKCGRAKKGNVVEYFHDKQYDYYYCTNDHRWPVPPAREQVIRCKYEVIEDVKTDVATLVRHRPQQTKAR